MPLNDCLLCNLPATTPRDVHEFIHFVLRVRPRWVRVQWVLYQRLVAAVVISHPGRSLTINLGRGHYVVITPKGN